MELQRLAEEQVRAQRDNPCSSYRCGLARELAVDGLKKGMRVGFTIGAVIGIPLAFSLMNRNFDWKNPAAYALITSVASLAGSICGGFAGAVAGAARGLFARVDIHAVHPHPHAE